MKIFNTLTRQKDELVPITPGEYKIYCCGPTVYNYIHIGNARPLCTFDVLRRYLEFKGNKVDFVQNFTDVDDKLIRRAKEEDSTVKEISEKYIEEFLKDAKGLNIRPATYAPRATENIDEMIVFIENLIKTGYAYEHEGDVYFRVDKDPTYGKLSKQMIDELVAGARVDVNSGKENPVDFALWKAAKPGEISWASPWGEGRPGWHIECSVMAKKYLGETIDIHCGGQDLIFPHHENEIAQSECGNGEEFARYFMHNGYINIDNEKMSKSKGNFFTVRDMAEEYGYETIRYMMVSSYYRSALNYSTELLEQCASALERLYNFRSNLDFWKANATDKSTLDLNQWTEQANQGFYDGMDNDLNMAEALGPVFEFVRDINTAIGEEIPFSKADITFAMESFDQWMDILGILTERNEEKPSADIEKLIDERKKAREAKDFAKADEIRDQLSAKGIILEDTPQGVRWIQE